MLLLEDEFPNFKANTSVGSINLHDFMNDSWCLLMSHPLDFTPVCTTELASAAKHVIEFEKRNVKLLALACSPLESHKLWIEDISAFGGMTAAAFPFPIIDDGSRDIAVMLGMIHPQDKTNPTLPLTVRHCFLISPDKKLKLILMYADETGRNFREILRVVDSIQLSSKYKVCTPANWNYGEDCMVLPSVREDELALLFPESILAERSMPSGRPYMRFVKCPKRETHVTHAQVS